MKKTCTCITSILFRFLKLNKMFLSVFLFFWQLVEGNSNGDKESTHWLSSPITARFLRFNPKTWNNSPCLRVEVYGCQPGTKNVSVQQRMLKLLL